MKPLDLAGKKVGRLTFIRRIASSKEGSVWLAECDCGTQVHRLAKRLRLSAMPSCGCWKSERIAEIGRTKNRRHGMRDTPTYACWQSMLTRCHGRSPSPYWGGRGITVCDRWRTSFEAFLEDMGERPPGHSLDRIDVNGNYEPGNVRWATAAEQMHNRRDNVIIEAFGERLWIGEWSSRFGIDRRTIKKRLFRGWDGERAVSAPLCPGGPRKRVA